jgi:hypothetical protein
VLVAAAVRRDRAAMGMGLAGLATLVLAGGAWLAAVALPNWDRLRTALAIWPRVEYLDSPVALAGRLGRYLADSDQALGRSLPLLVAAVIGLAALARRWPRLTPAARDALVMAALWGVGLWLAVAVADYLPDHYGAPNRYVVPALPGLAVLAGFGLADLAALAGRGRARVAGVVGVVLGVAVALPGVVAYLDGAMASGRSREQGQRVLATSLPEEAVVYGAYAPTLLFDTRLATLTPWPSAGANVGDPIGRLGVTHLLVGPVPSDPTSRVMALPGVVAYLDGAMASGRSREQGQRVLATSLPEHAVVYGAYAPTLLFDTRLATLTPWPSADANVGDPIGRLGVTHLLVGPVPSDPTSRVMALPGAGRTSSLARVRWGPGELFLYDLPGAGVSPVAAPIDYDPVAGPSRQT